VTSSVANLAEWREVQRSDQRAVTSEEGWRLYRAFRRIPDAKRREEIIELVARFAPKSPDWPSAG
jgi:hypothetical protein